MAKNITVIGGGFYGCIIALELHNLGKEVTLVETEADLMQRASYNNQARIHRGYHYPRSLLTALRTRQNFSPFVEEFHDCVDRSFDKYYAIARMSSKTNAVQFNTFCNRINVPIAEAADNIKELFNTSMIENIFKVSEYTFNTDVLKTIIKEKLKKANITLCLSAKAHSFQKVLNRFEVVIENGNGKETIQADHIYNCTYSNLNYLLQNDHAGLIPLKYEYTEMVLIRPPDILNNLAITVVDGPFFSCMPFPSKGLYSLSHVRYTPHFAWAEAKNKEYLYLEQNHQSSNKFMIKDAARYMPILEDAKYVESIWEVKTILPRCEVDDSRPILFKEHPLYTGFYSVLGGKIDNIIDIREKIREVYRS